VVLAPVLAPVLAYGPFRFIGKTVKTRIYRPKSADDELPLAGLLRYALWPMTLNERVRGWARALGPMGWRNIVPPSSGWLRLLASFTSYLLVLGALATVIGKTMAMEALAPADRSIWLLMWAVSQDLLVYFGSAAVLAALEMWTRRWLLLTIPLALVASLTGMLNTVYLAITGEQATGEAFVQLAARIGDALDIAGEVVSIELALGLIGGLTLGIAIPFLLRRFLRRRNWNFEQRTDGRARMLCAGWIAVLSLLVVVMTPQPKTVMARNLGKNALFKTLWTLTPADTGSFAGYKPSRLASSAIISRFADGAEHPNVVVVVLESTRFDRTSLSDHPEAADTPTLEQLAEEGLSAPRARAVLPHTTKSLFSILCGRYPLMQKKVAEVSADLKVQCLPSILAEAGYETAFFQSSWGTFEWRPRLVQRLGFGLFRAWEDIRGQELGYLASDDESLAAPFGKWLDEIRASKQPFMATLLTSAPHHPYRLSRRAEKAAHEGGLPIETDEQRYLRLLEAEDRLLEALLKALERRRLRDKTIVVVVGDHGEGFGEKGVKQHDNNFYEEGLRVPLVIVGPGVPQREVEGNATLLDVTPTLLALLGIELDAKGAAALDGHNLLAEDFPGDLPRYFSCWFEMRCRGFVVGETKVVYEPQADEAWYYDLANDPEENEPLPLDDALNKELKLLQDTLRRFRADNYSVVLGAAKFGDWRCAHKSRKCRHPKAK
jgi:arylsulfatase A-like enzyme